MKEEGKEEKEEVKKMTRRKRKRSRFKLAADYLVMFTCE